MLYDIDNILYTPLDTPKKPRFNVSKLKKWLKQQYVPLGQYREWLSTSKNAAEHIIQNYPWDLTVAYFSPTPELDKGWLGNFDKEFPTLSKYMHSCFNLSIDDIGIIVFLPIKTGHTGLGFWHNDTDWYGLRHYFVFEHSDKNKLLLKKTKIKNVTRQDYPVPINEELYLQKQTYECKLLSSKQSFFLNNINSVHSTYTEIPNVTRIAAFVTGKIGKTKLMKEKIQNLVIASAIKYKDYAIFYNDQLEKL